MFWVISVKFIIRNTLPKSGTFLLRHPVYVCLCVCVCVCVYIYIYIISQKSLYVSGGGVDGLVVGDGTLNKVLPEFYSMVPW